VEPDGSLRFASPQATEWLDRIRATDRERTGVTELPTVVASAIAGLRASGAASSVVTQTCGVDMRIEATTAGPDGGAAIVIRPERPAAPPPPPRTWPLTAQERAVSVHLLAGRSNAEIAAALFVSENTVQTHLRNIYGKLEVTSRTQLLARYFREVFGAIYS
jgi:DNA-binding NarL/FixJ family response regulator